MNLLTDGPADSSVKRIAAAGVFGFLSAGYLAKAAEYTIPDILASTRDTDIATAQAMYESSVVLQLTALVAMAFCGAALAGFLARRRGIWAGLLSNSLYVFLAAREFFLSVSHIDADPSRTTSPPLYSLLRLVLWIAAASSGGFVGEKYYSPDWDLDLNQDKATVFGVYWPHYFWAIPIVNMAFLGSLIIVTYGIVVDFLVDFYYAWHPSLWLKLDWWAYFASVPLLLYLAAWLTVGGFIRFYEVMQHRRSRPKGWGKFGRAVLYGVGAPALSYTLAAFGVRVTHLMPKPATGDWKIALAFVVILLAIGLGISAYSWVKQT